MKEETKRLLKAELIIILIAVAVGTAFVIPKYFVWQENRKMVKYILNIDDEDDMNRTQKFGLQLCDDFHVGMMPSLFLMPFTIMFVCGNALIVDRKPLTHSD